MTRQSVARTPLVAKAPTMLCTAIILIITSNHAKASDVYELDKVVVTAARTAQTVDETLAPVTVIARQDIERAQASSVPELLSKVPGVQIASNGGPGSMAGVYIRGTKTAQTLILVDGHKVNTPEGGDATLQYLDPDQIERIEVVRGPRSSLYGADAVGGVINIFTRKGSDRPALTFKAGMGSHGTAEYGVNIGGEQDGTRFSLGARLFETQGYDRTTNTLGTEKDDDAFRNKSFSGSLSRMFEGGIEVGANFSHAEGKSEYDMGCSAYGCSTWEGGPRTYFNQSSASVFLAMPVNEAWDIRLNTGYARDKRSDKENEYGDSHATNQCYSASWLNDIAWTDDQLLTAGVDYSIDKVDSSNSYSVDERYNVGVFAQNHTSFESSELQLGGRYDKNEAYGNKATGNIAWGFSLPKQMRLVASYGTAFRAPTFVDLYYPGSESPDLKPETSKNAEVELKGQFGRSSNWSVNVFQNDMNEMLVWDLASGRMSNVEEARVRGIELSAGSRIFNWDINANLSLLNPENLTTGKQLERRAKQLFNLDADRQWQRWGVGATFRAQGSSWNDAANTESVAGFGTLDLRASMQITQDLSARLKLVNLMDKKYTTTLYYLDQPRSAYLTLIWTPAL